MSQTEDDVMPPLADETDSTEECLNQVCVNDSDDDDDNENSWSEMEEEQEPFRCLFCHKLYQTMQVAFDHLKDEHKFDLKHIKRKFNLDQYSYIKMINFIRSKNVESAKIESSEEILWNDEEYLKPVEIDAWLMFDIDELKETDGDMETSLSDSSKSEAHQIEDLKRTLDEKNVLIEQLVGQIEQMKLSFHSLLNVNGDSDSISKPQNVGQVSANDDEAYFSTYAHFDIHHDMLSDTVRTSSYRNAILNNSNLFANKMVMDVGCGTSILSMFASRAGAATVIAIDQSEIIYHAMDIARANGISNIQFVKGRLEDTFPLKPDERVDIIISEWMGYFLLFEGMLDSVIFARDKYLKPGGLILPNRCNISLVAFGDEKRHNEYITFWNDVYGFNMNIMQTEVLKEAIVEICPNQWSLSEPVVIADFDLNTVDYDCPNFSYDFSMKIKQNGKLTSFIGYFDTFFDLPNPVHFTTGPQSKSTHWKQVIFYIRDPVEVKIGEVVCGKFQCRRGKKDVRALLVQINVFDQTFTYNLS